MTVSRSASSHRAGAPTVVARALAVVHTAMYDAWAPYDPVAVGTRLGGSLRRPASVVTPPFAEYTSGHSAVSAAASQVFTRFVGTDKFKVALTTTVRRGTSTIEPGLVPAKDTVLKFASFSDAANQAGMSRRYGGLHFQDGDMAGPRAR